MFKLPLFNIIFLLLLGMGMGWIFNYFYMSTYQAKILHAQEPPLPAQATISSMPKLDEEEIIKSKITNILSRYETAQSTSLNNLTPEERESLEVHTSRLMEEAPHEAQQILNDWLKKDPYDVQAKYLLAENYFKKGAYSKALEILLALKPYPQIIIPDQKIQQMIDQVVGKYTQELHASKQYTRLLTVYQRLIETAIDPNKYYYALAEVQIELKLYEEAITSLNNILHDAVWGKLAQGRATEIQIKLDLSDEVAIPLEKVGDQFVVSVSINGVGGIRLLLDTGASICVLRPQAATQVGLSFDEDDSEEIIVSLASGTTNTPSIIIDSMEVGSVELNNVLTSILEMPPGTGADGLLGMNFLGRFKFFIDQNTSTLYLGSR